MTDHAIVRKVVVPAAGLGTRFLPASRAVPKEMFPIIDRPLLQYIIEEAVMAGAEEVILVLSPDKKAISNFFERDRVLEKKLQETGKADILQRLRDSYPDIRVVTVIQEEAKGLGHAILMSREAVGDEPFAVALPDVLLPAAQPCLREMLAIWEEQQCGSVAVVKVPREQVSSYGIVSIEETGGPMHRIASLVEKPHIDDAPSDLAILGRYVLPPQSFAVLEQLVPGALGEIQLTDALQALADQWGLFAYEYEGPYYDAGEPLGFILANVALAMNRQDYKSVLTQALKELLS